MIKHKDWDINEHATGRFKDGKPIIGVTLQTGLNDIEPDGSFVPCDTGVSNIVQGVTHLKMNRGRMGELRFGDSQHVNQFLIKIKNKQLKGVSFKYVDAVGTTMEVNNGKPVCSFDNGVLIESTPYYKGVKMDIILNDPLSAPTEFNFSSKTYGQEYTVVEENGGLTFRGADQEPIYIKQPYAIDADGDYGDVTIHYLGIVNNLHLFKKVVDEEWLRNAAAPVRVDPDVTIEDGVDGGVIADALVYVPFPNSNFGTDTTLVLNDQPVVAVHFSSFIYTDLSELTGITVTSALYRFWGNGGGMDCEIRSILREWTETGVTANSAIHGVQTWTTRAARGADTDYDSTLLTAEFNIPYNATNASHEISLNTEVIQRRIDDPEDNLGDVVCVKDLIGSSNTHYFHSSEGSVKPQFYMEYLEKGFGRRKKITQMRQLRK